MNTKRQSLINQSAELYRMIGYPPTAGQIMGLLYVSDQKYFTFQELIDTLKISKSAISKSLNFLLEIHEISFKTKGNNKRKRYFYISQKGTVKVHSVNSRNTICSNRFLYVIFAFGSVFDIVHFI